MQRTHIYLPEEINRDLDYLAKIENKPKAEVIRIVLKKGIQALKPHKSQSAQALLLMAQQAKKFKGVGPKDLSMNLDYYTWGGPKRNSDK